MCTALYNSSVNARKFPNCFNTGNELISQGLYYKKLEYVLIIRKGFLSYVRFDCTWSNRQKKKSVKAWTKSEVDEPENS